MNHVVSIIKAQIRGTKAGTKLRAGGLLVKWAGVVKWGTLSQGGTW
jgi:hypothetical protein